MRQIIKRILTEGTKLDQALEILLREYPNPMEDLMGGVKYLKELGFDESCLKSYGIDGLLNQNDHSLYLSAPLYQQAFRWFREKYDLHENVGIKHFIEKTYCYSIVSTSIPHYIHDKSHFASYEEAELECLNKLIEIIKNKKL
jgi:hypothetical protein